MVALETGEVAAQRGSVGPWCSRSANVIFVQEGIIWILIAIVADLVPVVSSEGLHFFTPILIAF